MKKKRLKLIFTLIMLLFSIFPNLNNIYEKKNEYNSFNIQEISHSAGISENIEIIGNSALALFPNKTGSGLFDDPYIIQDLIVDMGSPNEVAISLANINKYLTIKNCTIINVNEATLSGWIGIALESCSNIRIDNCSVINNYAMGILLFNSMNNTINDNNFQNYENGVILQNSNNNTISNNDFGECELGLIASQDNFLESNKFNQGGVAIRGSKSTNNTITQTNTINDNPVYYYENYTYLNLVDISNMGQLILVNCNDSYISENTISNTFNGIQLISSNNNTIFTNNLTLNDFGIFCSESNNNSIFSNNLSTNEMGIYLDNSKYNNLTSNILDNNTEEGIILYTANNNSISDNSISGIKISESYNNILSKNNFSYNGLIIEDSENNSIDQSNKLNGKSIHYYENEMNFELDSILDISQLILVNCSNINVSKINISEIKNGITFIESFNCKLANITINNVDIGISLYLSNNNTIIEDNITNCEINAIKLDNSNNNTLTMNNISNCNENGMYIYNSDHNLIENSTIKYNLYNGIFIDSSDYNNITENKILYNNRYGTYLNYANNNSMIKNLIANNYNDQRYESIGANFWDNGTIGNYWGDYAIHYPKATHDGMIWNTSYSIGSYLSSDRYPLFADVPSKPTTISENTTINTSLFVFQWNPISNADLYWIYVDGTFNSTSNNTSQEIIFNNNGIYEIEVAALNNSGISFSSDKIKIIVSIPPNIPDIPILITQDQTIQISNILLEWNDVDGVDEYKIYINGAFSTQTDKTSLKLNLNSNGTYFLTVSAFNETGMSNQSIPVLILVELIPNIPDIPILITQSQKIKNDTIRIEWYPVSGAVTYLVYINDTLNLTTENTYSDLKLESNQVYSISISALNSSGKSQKSNPILIEVEDFSAGEKNNNILIISGSIVGLISIGSIVILFFKKKIK